MSVYYCVFLKENVLCIKYSKTEFYIPALYLIAGKENNFYRNKVS